MNNPRGIIVPQWLLVGLLVLVISLFYIEIQDLKKTHKELAYLTEHNIRKLDTRLDELTEETSNGYEKVLSKINIEIQDLKNIHTELAYLTERKLEARLDKLTAEIRNRLGELSKIISERLDKSCKDDSEKIIVKLVEELIKCKGHGNSWWKDFMNAIDISFWVSKIIQRILHALGITFGSSSLD